jgi:hypothetical protein
MEGATNVPARSVSKSSNAPAFHRNKALKDGEKALNSIS